jgi:hypothetical protein
MATSRLPYVPITEDGVAHSQFSTFRRKRADTNGHQQGRRHLA